MLRICYALNLNVKFALLSGLKLVWPCHLGLLITSVGLIQPASVAVCWTTQTSLDMLYMQIMVHFVMHHVSMHLNICKAGVNAQKRACLSSLFTQNEVFVSPWWTSNPSPSITCEIL